MHPMLNIAVRAARRAGTIIVRGQARLYEVKVTKKGPQDYVTQVDKDAEAAIIDTLRTAYPDHAVLAEESGGSFEEVFLDWTLVAWFGFVVLEPLCEFVGVVEDLLDRSGHRGHLRNSSRAGMAWTMNSTPSPTATPTSSTRPLSSAPTSMMSPSRSKTRIGWR